MARWFLRITTSGERAARRDAEAIEERFRPRGTQPTLPDLSETAKLDAFLTYARLNRPRVEATYFNWLASVERSLPDRRSKFSLVRRAPRGL